MEKKESVTKMIEGNTKESLMEPSEIKNSQIAEMIRKDRKYAKEAVNAFTKILYSEKYKR